MINNNHVQNSDTSSSGESALALLSSKTCNWKCTNYSYQIMLINNESLQQNGERNNDTEKH
jgi:hypothetical protein